MSLRLALLAAVGLIAACGSGTSAPGGQQAQSSEAQPPADDGKVDCATDGADTFLRVCTVERDGSALTIRSPSGDLPSNSAVLRLAHAWLSPWKP